MYSWLVDLHLEEYLPLFLNAGYDMRTVSKMTPEVSYYYLLFVNNCHYSISSSLMFIGPDLRKINLRGPGTLVDYVQNDNFCRILNFLFEIIIISFKLFFFLLSK